MARELDLPPGTPVTLLTDDLVINLRVINVRKRVRSIEREDIPADAHVLGVELRPQGHPLHPKNSGVSP